MAELSTDTIKTNSILVSAALMYAKRHWGKPNYYKDPLEAYRKIQTAQEEFQWFSADQFVVDTMPGEPSKPTFSQSIADIIDRKRLVDSDVYRAAGIDRSTFSRMVNAPDFVPGKDSCLAFLFVLNVDEDTAQRVLSYAGYTLDHENNRDLYIESLLSETEYRSYLTDICHVNEVLEELGVGKLVTE